MKANYLSQGQHTVRFIQHAIHVCICMNVYEQGRIFHSNQPPASFAWPADSKPAHIQEICSRYNHEAIYTSTPDVVHWPNPAMAKMFMSSDLCFCSQVALACSTFKTIISSSGRGPVNTWLKVMIYKGRITLPTYVSMAIHTQWGAMYLFYLLFLELLGPEWEEVAALLWLPLL